MSSDSSNQVALQGFDVEIGASNYMVQPTPNQGLQLVVSQHSLENDFPIPVSVHLQDGAFNINSVSVRGRNPKPSKKKGGRKEGHQFTTSGGKKQRLIWTPDLHQNFLVAHNSSLDKPVPKKILEQMRINFPYITRENVASHLQKHRLYLKKQKNKDGNSSKSSPKSVSLNSTTKQSNFKPTYNNSSSNFTCPNARDQLPLQSQSDQLPLQSQSDQIPLQSQSVQNETFLNQPMNVLSQILDQAILQPLDNIGWNNNNDFHGGNLNPIWPNMINPLEGPILGQSWVDYFHPSTSTTQFSNNIVDDPNAFFLPSNSVDHLSNDNYFFGTTLPRDFTMNFENLQVDNGDQKENMFHVGRYPDSLEFGHPMNFNHEMKNEYEQVFQTIFYQPTGPVNHPNDASTLPQPQTFANSWEEEGQRLKTEGEGSN